MTFRPAEPFEDYFQSIPIPASPSRLYDPIRYTLNQGGKRVRPQLVITAACMFGRDPDMAFPAASAVEMLHNFTLIHDDIMDNAETRRGNPTVFKKWGLADAVLSGDALFNMAYRSLFSYSKILSASAFSALLSEFDRAVTVVCEGQAMDMELAQSTRIDESEYEQMIYAKTASLIESSLKIGGILAGASPENIALLGEIGRSAGIAFQIQDDLLDALPQNEKFGKRQGGDIREGKKTLLWVHFINAISSDEERTYWENRLVDASKDENAVNEILRAFETSNVFQTVEQASNKHYAHALNLLSQCPQNEYSTYLTTFFEKLIKRDA